MRCRYAFRLFFEPRAVLSRRSFEISENSQARNAKIAEQLLSCSNGRRAS